MACEGNRTVFAGKAVSGGIAVGRIRFLRSRESGAPRVTVEDTEAEIARFEQAKESVKRELSGLYEKALAELGEAGAAIFEVHRMLLDDLNFVEAVTERIEREKLNAEAAVATTRDQFCGMFEAMDNAYMRARAADVKDIGSQVIAKLEETAGRQTAHGSGRTEVTERSAGEQAVCDDEKNSAIETAEESVGESPVCADSEPVILVADELSPSEAVRLDRKRVLAIVTRRGSVNSHTAILVRAMGLPALTGVEFGEGIALDGRMGIVDGYEGLFLSDPDEKTLEEYRARQERARERAKRLEELKDQETVTKGGRRIRLCANIGGTEDADTALADGAEGIGLFRSEFLYLGADDLPTEEEQFEAYRAVAEKMAGREVIIRTLDLGSDKNLRCLQLPHEENPALGCRGIRLCLERTELFRTQLRAILRAAYYGNVAVMYPMIISVDEVRRAKALVEETRAELDEEGIPYGEVRQGIMVETPAAVWLSRELAREVDFFSIGTNDLTQYMLAVDRQDPRADAFGDPHHPAVLGAVRAVVENAHQEGIWAGICGELAADTTLTEEFLRMGADELSVVPAHILAVRAAVRACPL